MIMLAKPSRLFIIICLRFTTTVSQDYWTSALVILRINGTINEQARQVIKNKFSFEKIPISLTMTATIYQDYCF
jgi:hypothetical protein